MLFLKAHYQEVVQKDLILTEAVKSASAVSCPTKIILSIGGENLNESYIISCLFILKYLTGHKPYIIRQKLENFQEGEALGSQLILRKSCMYMFLDQLLFSILQYAKHFEGFQVPTHHNSFSFVITDLFSLDELGPVLVYLDRVNSIQCQFYFSTTKAVDVNVLCKSFSICSSDS